MSDREVLQLAVTYAVGAIVVSFFVLIAALAILSEILSHGKLRHALRLHRRHGVR